VRRKAATILLILGFVAIGLDLYKRAPREVKVRLRWAEKRHEMRSATVVYERDGERVLQATFRYRDGAPYEQRHVVRLARGRYVARVSVEYASAPRSVRLPFEVRGQDEIALEGPW